MSLLLGQEAKVVLPAEVLEEMPLPSDPKVTFLGGLFMLALLAAAYVASEIVLPFVFAIVLKLLLQPAFRMLERLHVPRTIASLLLILTLFGTIVGLGAAISGPARTWAAKLPEGIPRLQERLSRIAACDHEFQNIDQMPILFCGPVIDGQVQNQKQRTGQRDQKSSPPFRGDIPPPFDGQNGERRKDR